MVFKYKCAECGHVCSLNELKSSTSIDKIPYGDTFALVSSYDYFCPECGAEYDEDSYTLEEDEGVGN